MSRKARQREIETAVQPLLSRGEQVRRSGPAWAVEQSGRAPLIFRARDLHQVVLTDQRLVLLTQPRRRRPLGVNNLVIAKKYSTFGLHGVKRLRPMLQVRLRAPDGRVLVLEFRPRDRRLGLELVEELGDTGNGDAAPRPRALPAAPAVPVQPDHAPVRPAPTSPAPPPTYAAPAPAPTRPQSFPVPIQPVDAPGNEGVWPPQESEGGSRKEKRAAKKQAKQQEKEARKAGKQDEKQAKKKAKSKKSSEHQEMLDYLQK